MLSGHKSKNILNKKKANILRYWYELVEECLEIEEQITHKNSIMGDWWKKIVNYPKRMGERYKKRVKL